MAWLSGYKFRKKITATGTTDASGWVSPTGDNDPAEWTDEGDAYDNDTESYAYDTIAAGSWSSYLELTHAALYCDKVRFYAHYNVNSIDKISVDVFYGGGWHNIYFEGAYASETWVEKAIGSTQLVTAARVKFHNDALDPIASLFYEFDFNEVKTVTNFPVMLYLSTSSGKSSADISHIFDIVPDADRKKIAITTDDETTECYVEIEKWDDGNEKAWLHYKAPAILPVNSDFYFYYGADAENTDHVGDTNSAAAENVWASKFKFVSHMVDDGIAAILDSTQYSNDGAKKGNNEPIEAAGKVGLAQDFVGGDDYINVANDNSLEFGTNPFTVSFCIKTPDTDTYRAIIGNRLVGDGWYIYVDNRNLEFGSISFYNTPDDVYIKAVPTIDDNTWHHVVVVRNGIAGNAIYYDRVSIEIDVNTDDLGDLGDNENPTQIGRRNVATPDRYFEGLLDEMRVSTGAETPTWIKMTYDTLWDDLVTWVAGTEAHLPVGGGSITPVGTLAGVIKFLQSVGQGAITAVGALNRKIKLAIGSGSITPAGALNRVIKLLVGEGSITPVGVLVAVMKFWQNVGQGAITAVGTLGRKIKLVVGSGAITPTGALAAFKKFFQSVGEGAITPVGILDASFIVKLFQAVGQGVITPIGVLGRNIKLAVGSGAITPIGTLNRLIKLLVGSGSIIPTGALTAGIKLFVSVGQGAVTIAGALNRKIKLTIGQGAITPVGTLAWGMVRNLILKVNEGNIYRMVVNEGMVYRLKTIAGKIYRMITKEG